MLINFMIFFFSLYVHSVMVTHSLSTQPQPTSVQSAAEQSKKRIIMKERQTADVCD